MIRDVIEQVAVVTGRIVHAGTGKAVDGRVTITAVECPIATRLLETGEFAVSTRPEMAFPNLAAQPYRLSLTIRADSDQYRAGFHELAMVQPIPAGSTFEPPIDLGVVTFPADPLNIRGRVVKAADPDTPIAAATVELLQGGAVTATATSGGDGRFRFDDAAIAAGAEIRCAAGGFRTVQRRLTVDFGLLLNEEFFRLPPL